MIPKKSILLTSLFLTANFAGTAFGSFVLVDNFNSLTTGDLGTQNGWATDDADGTRYTVTDTSPFSASDKGVLNGANGSNPADMYKALGNNIDNNTTGTLFFQMYVNDKSAGTSIGLADSTVPSVGGTSAIFNTFRTQLAFSAAGDFTARNGGSSATLDQSGSMQTGVMYSVWAVSNNTSNTSQFYIQGGTFTEQTQLTAGSGTITSFAYRSNNPASDSLTYFLSASSGAGGGADSIALDNIYIDNTGVNLVNPIPEPGTYALLIAFGMLTLAVVRRRRS